MSPVGFWIESRRQERSFIDTLVCFDHVSIIYSMWSNQFVIDLRDKNFLIQKVMYHGHLYLIIWLAIAFF